MLHRIFVPQAKTYIAPMLLLVDNNVNKVTSIKHVGPQVPLQVIKRNLR